MSPSPPRSSPEVFRAKTSQWPEPAPAWRASTPAFGGSLQGSFASYDPGSSLWKTSQLCLDGEWETYSETWPRAGTMRAGIAYQARPSVPLNAVIGSSWSRGEYPTPSATEYGSSQNEGVVPHKRPTAGTPSLSTWARQWPTPSASDYKGSTKVGQRRRQLSEAVIFPDGPRAPTTCTHGDACKPTLNPRFVAWLMGFPLDWTGPEPPTGGTPSRR